MSKVLVTDTYLEDIADAIRGKTGSQSTYKPGQMAAAITALPDPSGLGTKTITENGTYPASGDDLDGYSSVTVNVSNSYAAGDEGKVVSNGALVVQTSKSVTTNGTVDTTLNNEVVVNVSGGGGSSVLPGAVRLTPYATDIATGYISGSAWYAYQQNYADCRADVYVLDPANGSAQYLFIMIGGSHNRFRILQLENDPTALPEGTTAQISGALLTECARFNSFANTEGDDKLGKTGGLFLTSASINRTNYLVVSKTNIGVDGIESYVLNVGGVT